MELTAVLEVAPASPFEKGVSLVINDFLFVKQDSYSTFDYQHFFGGSIKNS